MGKIRDFWSGNRTARTRTISCTKYGKSVLLGISARVKFKHILCKKKNILEQRNVGKGVTGNNTGLHVINLFKIILVTL